MDPFTQRMLERARARQEKIDQKLASSGQKVPKRKPLTENAVVNADTPVKSPGRPNRESRGSRDSKPTRDSLQSPKKEILSPKRVTRSPKILTQSPKLAAQDSSTDKAPENMETKMERNGLRHNVKSRLDRLGVLYSDKADLSSPIHRTELEFSSETPPSADTPRPPRPLPDGKRKFGRLAALADTINNWEDDLTHHTAQPEPAKKTTKTLAKALKDESTLDVSIHSLNDINNVLQAASRAKESPKPIDTGTFTKPSGNETFLNKNVVAELEPSASTPSAAPAPDMATMVASNPPTVAKKPSIKKYRAPTPPRKIAASDENCDKDKENNVLQREENDNEASETCLQTKPEGKEPEKGSPVVKRLAPKLNGNVDRNSVLSKAAMFEAGSPRAKDPAEMSLRERKALFEKNKGTAIVPKAPFGMAPSAKSLHGDLKDKPKGPVHAPPQKPAASRTNSKENIPDDNVSQTSVGGGIKGKLAALFSKEQTISESTIANKNKQERNKEMEMLQNRFNFKAMPEKAPEDNHESEDEQSEHDPSEDAPLMGSTLSLSTSARKPEIISNVPKVTFEQAKTQGTVDDVAKRDEVVATQPGKRRSSQDSTVVLSVLEDVKRIKVNNKKDPANGTATLSPPSLYPHLSDIETDTSHTQEEYSDCGGSSGDNLNDNLNKSDNWAETSFGREVMNVVKKNNSSYKKAVRETDSETSVSDMNSELDDCLDEALNDEESEGPTPPKINKNGNTLSSKSFTYEQGSPAPRFKSPLKIQPPAPATPRDHGGELVHSVSFYRRMQSASQASTPLRTVRHSSPEREPATPDGAPAAVTTVRRRIKELHNEINKQQTVISQASQALNLCAATVEFSGSTEQAEGERLLLLATHRRQACLHEAQRLQVEGAGLAAEAGMASLHIRGITAPLRRDYARRLHADDATGHHAVCLLKCRDRVLATSMQLTQAPNNSLHFPDEIRMEGLASDFKVTIEVYLLPATKELLPHDVKYHITNKKSNAKLLTPKSKVSQLKAPSVQSPGGPLTVRSPQFQPHGYCIFALPQATRDTFTFNKVPAGSPVDGTLQLRIEARVRVPPPPPHAAFLTAFDDVSGLGAWHRRWFVLQPPRLTYWKYPDDVNKKMPIGDIDLTTVISDEVTRAPRDLCARPHTLLLESSVPAGLIVPDSGSLVYFRRPDGSVLRRHLLAADTQKDRDEWLECLNKALEYVRCCKMYDE